MEKLSEKEKCNHEFTCTICGYIHPNKGWINTDDLSIDRIDTELKRIGLQIGENTKTAHEMRITFYGIDDARAYDHDEIILMNQYAGQEIQCPECLKKNEEIDKINEELRLYLEAGAILTKSWEGLQNEISELKFKLQASEERVKELELLVHEGLSHTCLLEDEIKFCRYRHGDGNKCIHCSNLLTKQ